MKKFISARNLNFTWFDYWPFNATFIDKFAVEMTLNDSQILCKYFISVTSVLFNIKGVYIDNLWDWSQWVGHFCAGSILTVVSLNFEILGLALPSRRHEEAPSCDGHFVHVCMSEIVCISVFSCFWLVGCLVSVGLFVLP